MIPECGGRADPGQLYPRDGVRSDLNGVSYFRRLPMSGQERPPPAMKHKNRIGKGLAQVEILAPPVEKGTAITADGKARRGRSLPGTGTHALRTYAWTVPQPRCRPATPPVTNGDHG